MRKIRYHRYAYALIPLAMLDASEALCKCDSGVTWEPSEAVAEGTACSSLEGDTQILTMGNDLSMLATKLRLDLPAAPNVPLVGLENCGVRIPATVLAGRYLDQATLRIAYGVQKTSGTSAKVTAAAGFAAEPGVSFTVDLPPGAMSDMDRVDEETLPFLVTSACSGTPYSRLFRTNVAMSGIKSSTGESMLIGAIAPMDFRYDVTLSSKYCPSP